MGHAWDELGGPPQGLEGYRRDVWLRCTRCAMLRAFDIAHDGATLWPRYWPPTGYAWEGERGAAPTRRDYRVAWLRERKRGHRGA